MIKSMTGYGRAKSQMEGREIQVEIKSVNHRFLEYAARLPKACGYLEEPLKKLVQSAVSRGKTEVGVTIAAAEDGMEVEVNQSLAEEYVGSLRKLGEQLGLKDDLSLSALIQLPDLFTVRKKEVDEEALKNAVVEAAGLALESFNAMRETEGARLKEDVLSRLNTIEANVGKVEERSPQTVEEYRARLMSKLKEILGGAQVDEQRVVMEAAIVADKLAVDEETVRLRSHIQQMRSILELPEPVGRKLDFLVQEMNREANTIGSKAQDVTIARIVVEIKSEIEKIREQIQNIE